MTKKEKLIQRKNIRNYLPKFDLGGSIENSTPDVYSPVSSIGLGVAEKGVLRGDQYVKTARLDEPGANLGGKASAYSAQKTGSIVNAIEKPIESIATSFATPIGAALMAPPSLMGQSAMNAALAGSWIGAAANIPGAVMGVMDAVNQFDAPAISDDEFDAMKGEQTMSGINGVEYKLKTGVNMSDVSQIGAAKEGSDIAAAANAGSGLGALAGGLSTAIWATAAGVSSIPFLGWFLGPIIAAAGAGLGAAAGAGATDSSDEAIEQARQVNNTIERWNTHEAAVANSQGIRELYDKRQQRLHGGQAAGQTQENIVATADYGKSPYGPTKYKFIPNSKGEVASSDGIRSAAANAVVGRGEVVANTENGTAFNITYGKRGDKENVLANLKDSDMVLSDNPEMIIPGTEYLFPGGITPAQAGRLSAQTIFEINKAVQKDSKYRDSNTARFQLELANKVKQPHLLNLQLISQVLDYMKKNKEYKNGIEHALNGRSPYSNLPHYNFGSALLLYGLPNLGGLFGTIGNAIMYADAKNEDIAPAPQIHVSNADAQRAIQAMRSSYNVNPELRAALNIQRMLNYANRHNGYTAGQRMAMDQSAYANYANLVSRILANGQNISNKMWNDKQQALASLRDQDVARKMEANKYAHEWKARAEAAKQKRVDTYGSALYNNIQNWFQNIGNSITTGKMLKLYSDELDWKRGGNNNNKYPTDVPRLTFNAPDWNLTGLIQPLETLPSIEPWRLKFNFPEELQGKIQPLSTPIRLLIN